LVSSDKRLVTGGTFARRFNQSGGEEFCWNTLSMMSV
jgi:hypothetical protein